MTIKFNLSKKNYINFNFYFLKTHKLYKRNFIILKYLLPAIWMVLCLLWSLTLDMTASLINLALMSIVSVLWLVIWPKFYYNNVLKNITKQVDKGNYDSFLGDKEITLGEENIDCVSKNKISYATSNYKYSSVKKVEFDHDTMFVFISETVAIIIPLSAFENSEQKAEFLKILSEKSGVKISQLQ